MTGSVLRAAVDSSQVTGIHLPVLWAKVHLHDHTTTQARCFNQGSLWVNWSVLRWLAKKYDQVVLPCWMPRTLRFSTSSLEFENHAYRPNNANWWGICMHFTETYYIFVLSLVSLLSTLWSLRTRRTRSFLVLWQVPSLAVAISYCFEGGPAKTTSFNTKNNNCLWVYEFSLFTFVINTGHQVVINTLVLRWDA